MADRIWALIRKEFIQFWRDRFSALLVVYIFLEIALCGWALSMDVRQARLVVWDQERSAASRAVVQELTGSGYFRVAAYVEGAAALEQHLAAGSAQAALVIPAGFGRWWGLAGGPAVQFVVDGTNSAFAAQLVAYGEGTLRSLAVRQVVPRVQNDLRVTFSPTLNFTHFMMVAMVAIAVVFVGVILAAAAIIREREQGTLEQLRVSPVAMWEVVAAKLLAMSLIKLAGLFIGMAVAVFGFGTPLRGSLVLYLALSFLMFAAGLGLGAWIAATARTMAQAALLAFFILFPVMFLSGTMLPVENMPRVLQYLSLLSPLRYYTEISLGIFLKGVGLEVLWPQALALLLFGAAILSLSVWRLRRALE